jgi:hypothetical protein
MSRRVGTFSVAAYHAGSAAHERKPRRATTRGLSIGLPARTPPAPGTEEIVARGRATQCSGLQVTPAAMTLAFCVLMPVTNSRADKLTPIAFEI